MIKLERIAELVELLFNLKDPTLMETAFLFIGESLVFLEQNTLEELKY